MIKQFLLFGIMLLTSLQLFSQQLTHVQGEILVQLRQDVNPNVWLNEYRTHKGQTTDIFLREKVSEPMNIYAVKFDFGRINERDLLRSIRIDKQIYNAQFNHFVSLRSTTPNDAQFGQQWQYINTGQSGGTTGADIDMDLAWDVTTGGLTASGDTIVVCIIDDGIDLNHQDMIQNLWINYAEIPGNNIDDDNNGYIDDYQGWDTGSNTDDVGDGGGHGTPVAGIVGAKGNNNIGVAGVNWDVKLMIVEGGTGVESEVLEAYSYPLSFRKRYNETNGQEGAFVVATNASWGVDLGQAADAPLWCNFYDTLGVHGILNAGATINGNNNVDIDGDLPTTCPSEYLISVTNMNHNDQKVTAAGYGAISIDLGAFGEGTHTAAFGNSYGGFGGTSGATPHVAGTIGLLYATPCLDLISLAKSNPSAAAAQVRDYILQGVDANASLQGITVTGGRLNINNSMQLLMNNCGACIPPISSTPENITVSSANIIWVSNTSVNTVNLRWRELGTPAWNMVANVSSPYSLTSLNACTSYEFQLQGACDSETTEYSSSTTFTTDGCCENPAQFDVVSTSDNSITLDWSMVTTASAYTIRYRESSGGSWTSISTTNLNASISGLTECTSYEFQIQVDCNGMQPPFSSSISASTSGCGACIDGSYCPPPGLNAGEEWIDLVEFNSINNNSGSDGGYGDFTTISTSVNAGQSYGITLTPAFSGQSYTEFFRVWIDYNQDGDFDDADELAYESDATSTTVNGTIAIPASAMNGSTRMRVYMLFDTAPSPCTTTPDNFGEVEDYCITIIAEDGSCPAILTVNDNPIADGTYHAAQEVSSNGVIAAASNVNYKAGTQICLNQGFEVAKNVVFEASIEACN